MPLPATIVWETQTGGDDTFGGGFNSAAAGGTDYSFASSPTSAHVVFNGTTVYFTAAGAGLTVKIYGYEVLATDVGNMLNATGGTNVTPGRYCIASVVTGAEGTQSWTVTGPGNICTGAISDDGAGKMGGCLATPGAAAAAATIDGHLIWVKSGTYTITTDTPGPAGPVSLTFAIRVNMEGYQTTRGDLGTKPVLSAGAVAGTYSLFTCGGPTDVQVICNMKADGEATAGVNATGFTLSSARHFVMFCEAVDCNQANCRGFSESGGQFAGCKATNCETGFYGNLDDSSYCFCEANQCGIGFSKLTSGTPYVNCLAVECTGDGFISTTSGTHYVNCTADNNGGDGFDMVAASAINCLSTDNGGYGFKSGTTANTSLLINCAAGHGSDGNPNSQGATNGNFAMNDNLLNVTGNPYTGAGDYRPDNTANEGALLRAAGIGVQSQTNNRDIGAVQHADPAGGGGGGPLVGPSALISV